MVIAARVCTLLVIIVRKDWSDDETLWACARDVSSGPSDLLGILTGKSRRPMIVVGLGLGFDGEIPRHHLHDDSPPGGHTSRDHHLRVSVFLPNRYVGRAHPSS